MNNKSAGASVIPFRRKILVSLISGAIAGIQAAHAGPVLEEVIVTSTKELQNIQDIPQAITAFTTEDVVRRGFIGIDDYAKQIPSLSFARREPGGTSVIFRGVASSGIQFGTNPSSSVYLDEQPITSAGVNPNPRTIDVERLEALSGPQGTLFGDASQSGALRIITNKPNPSLFEGWVEGTVGNVDGGENEGGISAMVNIPLVENKIALRLVGFSYEEAGYIDNVLAPSAGGTFDNAAFVADDVNSGSEDGGRAALHWDINDDWMADAMAVFQKNERDGSSDVNLDVGDLEQVRYNKETSSDEWYQLGLTLEGDLGWAETVISMSYFDRDWRYDADATDYLVGFDQKYDNNYYNVYNFEGDPRARAFNSEEDERWSIEGRLQFEGEEGNWSAIVGFFYNKTEKATEFGSLVDNFSDTPAFYYLNYVAAGAYYSPSINDNGESLPAGTWAGVDTDVWFFGVYDQEIEDQAIFGEANIDITEDFTLTLGGRYYENEQDRYLLQGSMQVGPTPSGVTDYITNNERSSVKETGFVPKISARYQISYDKMVYATYSEGFRSGGGNAVRPSSVLPRSYDSDILKNYELGFKSSWLNNQVRVNLLAYHMVWEDIQIQINDPTIFSLGIVNFSEAEIDGYEMDLAWAPLEGLEITFNYSDITAEISESSTITIPDPDEDDIVAVDGTRLPITPENKASLGIEYVFQSQLMGFEPFIRADYTHVGESVNSLAGLESLVLTAPTEIQPDYDIIDLKFGMENELWSATLFIDNVDDERATQFINNRWGKQRVSINKPRTVGFTLRRRF